MRRTLLLATVGATAVVAATLALRHRSPGPTAQQPPVPSEDGPIAISHAELVQRTAEPSQDTGPVPGLDLLHVTLTETGAEAPAEGGVARLTLDPALQREVLALMQAHHLPEAAVVLMDVQTGKLLVYANHLDHGTPHDLCTEATAPSASVFKIVTAAALVEDAHLGPDTRQCYSGGEQRINASDLVEDPQRDRWCTTLAGAMGRSLNTVFARLAKERLTPSQLEAMAERFGYADPFSFDVPVQPGALHVPSEPLEFARTAAGFWNTTLSPLQAAEISAIVAREGEPVRPEIVEQVVSASGEVTWRAPEPRSGTRVVARETASQLQTMMEHTVSEGTSFKAFHDPKGGAFLPGIQVAGKTGTLTEAETQRYYTWFTGFAPSRPEPGMQQVAVAALVVNGPTWQVKANVLARDVLRAYFAREGAQGVSRPGIREIARRHKKN
jgi:cell division protein FtsI/penicillin-binding protein 2